MYAVVTIQGFQYRLEQGETVRIPKYDIDVGEKLKIPEVLLISDGDNISVGAPFVEGAVVEATVTGHDKDKKIVIFKKKRRKDYSVKRGHRQEFTEIIVNAIKTGVPKKEKKVKAVEGIEEVAAVPKVHDLEMPKKAPEKEAQEQKSPKKTKKAGPVKTETVKKPAKAVAKKKEQKEETQAKPGKTSAAGPEKKDKGKDRVASAQKPVQDKKEKGKST